MQTTIKRYALAFFCLFSLRAYSQIRLPQLISDGMVLQRNARVNVWGWASPGEKVTVAFRGTKGHATTGADGRWTIVLAPMQPGGPFTMTVKGSNEIVLRDILVGDVWFCSGQSNMVVNMDRVREKYPEEIPGAHYPEIRNFSVPTATDVSGAHTDLPGGKWWGATPDHLGDFGAASYFFAKKIFLQYHVPIGIINASVGGTPVQAWVSKDAIRSFPAYADRLERVSDTAFVQRANRKADTRIGMDPDLGVSGPLPWFDTAYTPQGWHHFWLPGYWADQGVRDLNGTVWFRKEIDVPASMTGIPAKLYMGRIVDADYVYVNGREVGRTTYQYPPRRYALPAGLLRPGKNLIVVKVVNFSGKGGFVPDKPYCLKTEGQQIDLRGDWEYKVGQVIPPAGGGTGGGISLQNEPTALYNAMVAPASAYTIKGFVWYQGEANTGKPDDYAALLTSLIGDWRSKWQEGNLPFLYAQLPNFMEVQYTPSESKWAELREEQRKVLTVPNTAMAVTIDAGEWNDIHPLDKKDVGDRLALAAEHLAYGDTNMVYSGPVYRAYRVEGEKVVLGFGNGPLVARGDSVLHYFAIAGADGKYVWAQARIDGNKVVVWSSQVTNPVSVRYAWADNPEGANLYNAEGLPASPFETGDSAAAGVAGDPGASSGAVTSGAAAGTVGEWNGKQCAVVLTYDDALNVDLDNVLPCLDSLGLKATFYLVGSSPVINDRMNEWRLAAEHGHELGNHTLYHPCDGSKPGRSFVTPAGDLTRYTVDREVRETRAANVLLKAIDGKDKRTFAYPCGDTKIGDTLFYDRLRNDFAGARGVTPGLQTAEQVNLDDINCYAINGQSAAYLIGLVRQAMQTHTLLVFLFHGVGGGHSLNVGLSEHSQLLHYLKQEENKIWIAPMVEVAEYIEAEKQKEGLSR